RSVPAQLEWWRTGLPARATVARGASDSAAFCPGPRGSFAFALLGCSCSRDLTSLLICSPTRTCGDPARRCGKLGSTPKPPTLCSHVGDRREDIRTRAQCPTRQGVIHHTRGEGVCVDRSKEVSKWLSVDEEGEREQGQQYHLEPPPQICSHHQSIRHHK